MVYDLKASKEQVKKDLIEGKGWNFLKRQNVWTGEVDDDSIWWDDFSGGWHDIWNQFLLNLGEVYDRLPSTRIAHNPFETFMKNGMLEYTYKSKEHFLYEFLLRKDLMNTDIVEWSGDLNAFANVKVEDVFETRKLEKDEKCNPAIPSIIYYITPKDKELKWHFGDAAYFKNKSIKEQFYILDAKSKYGTLRVDLSHSNEDLRRLEWEVDQISKYTCERCGKQPKDSKGNHIIWQSNGYWVEQLCKECARKECYTERHNDYKDALLTGKPYFGGPTIKAMMNARWTKLKDRKMIEIISSSRYEDRIESWYHWESFYHTDKLKEAFASVRTFQERENPKKG